MVIIKLIHKGGGIKMGEVETIAKINCAQPGVLCEQMIKDKKKEKKKTIE